MRLHLGTCRSPRESGEVYPFTRSVNASDRSPARSLIFFNCGGFVISLRRAQAYGDILKVKMPGTKNGELSPEAYKNDGHWSKGFIFAVRRIERSALPALP
jgi:hypothetical protein